MKIWTITYVARGWPVLTLSSTFFVRENAVPGAGHDWFSGW